MINFNNTDSKNYQQVQSQLNALVQRHLIEGEYSETVMKRRPGALNFSWFIRRDADVIMSHGVADKNYFWMKDKATGERYTNRLKAVLVPGEWMRQRMIKSRHISLPDESIISAGWPRLDLLRQLQKEHPAVSLEEKPSILWAPTHDKRKRGPEQKSTSSYPEFEKDAEKLKEYYEVMYSLHPRNRKDKIPTVDKLLRSNVVISDFGTIVYEAWALGKPVIFPRWILKDSIEKYVANSAEAFIFENKIGYHPSSYDEMLDIINSGPVISSDVDEFMTSYLDNYKVGESSKCVAEVLKKLAIK